MQEPVRSMLLYLVFPLWVAAGFADWCCHRRTRIATTSGLKENLLHLLLYAEMGLATLAVALLQINAAVLPLASLALLAILAWPQALALAGVGGETADWSLRWKERPLPAATLAAGALLAVAFNLGPLLQETWACLKVRTPANPGPR